MELAKLEQQVLNLGVKNYTLIKSKKLPKIVIQYLRKQGNMLPKMFYQSSDIVSGRVIESNPYYKRFFEKGMKPEALYTIKNINKCNVSHFNRLKTAYRDGGMVLVAKYIKDVQSKRK